MTAPEVVIDRPRHIARQRRRIRDYILQLALTHDEMTTAYKSKLIATLTACDMELERIYKHEAGTEALYERVTVFGLMALLLTGDHLDRLGKKADNGEAWSAEDKRLTKLLMNAEDTFAYTRDELYKQFTEPYLNEATLTEKFYFTFQGMTREQAEADAAQVRAGIKAAHDLRTTEELEQKRKEGKRPELPSSLSSF